MEYKDKKKYIITFIMAVIIIGIGVYWISNNNNNNKSTPRPKNAKSASSDTNKTKKTVDEKKVEDTTISNEKIKNLLFNGYMIQRKLEEKYLTSLQEVKIDSKEYKKIPDRFKDKQSIYNYCSKEFGLNEYYTEKYIKAIVDYVLRDINGTYYAIIGESGEYLSFKNAKIISKKYCGNKLDITFATNAEYDNSYLNYKAVLVKSGEKWLIDSCNFLIES